jgi:phosphohistidine phosphatase
MAKQLWLLRHAEAEPRGALPDERRPLTNRGECQSRAAGAALAALGVRIDLLLTSPRIRAVDTAKLTREALEEELEIVIHEPLSAGFTGGEALDLLAGQDARAHVMLVGHEPDLSTVIGELTGARVTLKKAGLAMVDVSGAAGRRSGAGVGPTDAGCELAVLARPRELALIAGLAVGEV